MPDHEHNYRATEVSHNDDGTLDILLVCTCGSKLVVERCWPQAVNYEIADHTLIQETAVLHTYTDEDD